MFNFQFLLKTVQDTLVSPVRFYHRNRFIRHFGYRAKYHNKDLLPRIKNDPFPLRVSPIDGKPNPWRNDARLFGQNDYIDILGDDKINPTQLMSSVPPWLRKFKGNEMQMLIRKRTEKSHWRWNRPQKWHELNKRIDYLYKRLNYKTQPKPPEYPSDY